mmetsp:Transcript_23077/g.35642  ORF Transcript_23077/g.35642 Transcript_23077/m.35642 type:complete len:215 (+) Transcript_23077:2412-3056(+)
MPIEGVDDTLGLIIPNLDSAIVCPGQDVGLITTGVVINTVDTALMSLKGVVWHRTAKSPNFDAPIKTGRGKGVSILGVEANHHDVVGMPFEELCVFKTTIPVPKLDGHIVTTSEEVWQGGMDLDISDVIGMSLKVLNFLHGVVVVHSDPHIVTRADDPLLAGDEFGTSYWQFGHLEGLDVGSRLIVPNGHVARVQCGEGPRFGGVNIHGFDTLG